MIVQPGLGGTHPFTETQHHTLFIGIYLVNAAEQPCRHGDQKDDHDAAQAAAAGQETAEPVLAFTQDVLKVGRLRPTRPPASPGSRTTATGATSLILPRHGV